MPSVMDVVAAAVCTVLVSVWYICVSSARHLAVRGSADLTGQTS